MLDENNKCKVYENRPNICRVDKTFKKYFSNQITQAEYYTQNTQMCNRWMKEDGVDEALLLNEKQYQ